MIPFRPVPFLSGAHAQTIAGALIGLPGEPASTTTLVELDDGDKLALEVSTPGDWREDHPTVAMIHGLCGCHRSRYLVRMARKLVARCIRAVRLNLRGCGSGRGLARALYHSGRSDDALAVLNALKREAPESPTTLIGFSLGGNIALKLAGELGPRAAELLHGVMAVCPPADLDRCSARISRPENALYDRHFVGLLRKDVAERHRRFPDLPPCELPPRLTLRGFDDIYTAPRSGFDDAKDYYTRCSSAPLVSRIEIPCRVLFANDDPVVDSTVLDDVNLPANVEVLRMPRGGHLGFLGWPGSPGGWRWMDAQLLAWLADWH